MARKSTKAPAAAAPPRETAEVSATERDALISAYQAGLITAWKRDGERGYRLTLAGARDEYVEAAKLGTYLGKLKSA